jgi:transposase
LKAGEQAAPKEAAGVVRKKVARDKAVRLYMEVGGNITNKDLAKKVGVSPATISKWKQADGWIDQLTPSEVEAPGGLREEAELDIGELASPEQIIQINQRIDSLLKRDYLTASEVADLAEAKSALLEAVDIYLAIVHDVGEMKSED